MPSIKKINLFINKSLIPIEITTKFTNGFNGKLTMEYEPSHKRHEIKFKAM
jgi:hypothetical protein